MKIPILLRVTFLLWGFLILCSPLSSGEPDYSVGPGDLLSLSFYPDSSLDREVQVRKDGTIQVPLVGSLYVAGKTPEEIARMIEDQLKGRFYQNPLVEVRVKEYHAHQVTLIGAVKNPGRYPLLPGETVLSFLQRTGGPKEEAPGGGILLSPYGISYFTWDAFFFSPTTTNFYLPPSSTIYFFPRGEIFVLGEVRNPGSFPYREGITLMKAIGMAGGFLPRAKESKVVILRNPQEKIEVDTTSITEGRSPDFPLQMGDLILVPERFF